MGGLPNIEIEFQTSAITAIQRSQKGVVALIVRDTNLNGSHEILNVNQIPSKLSEANKKYIERTFIGYQTPPRKVLLFVVGKDAELTAAYEYLATQSFDYMCLPPETTPEEVAFCSNWIKSQRLNNKVIYKAVLPNSPSDNYAIVNFTTEKMKSGSKEFTTAEYCSRIAGLIAGTSMKISCTYAPLPELTDVSRLTKEEMDTAIDRGELIALHDGVKVKVGRAVNSFVTTTDGIGETFKKIKIVEAVDMISYDIRMTTEDSYIGKYANNYDNKCLLITAIKGYLQTLESDGILQRGSSFVEVDMEAQVNYLTSIGIDTSTMSEQEIKEANTGSSVFLLINTKILDAIEDVYIKVGI